MSDKLFWLIVLEVSGVPIRDWLAVSHLAMNEASMATGVEVSSLLHYSQEVFRKEGAEDSVPFWGCFQ